MNESERNWRELEDEARESQIFDALVQIELKRADPVFSNSYMLGVASATDGEDVMRLEIQMQERVAELRGEGKISPIEELRSKAKAMIGLCPDEMIKALNDFSESLGI